MKENNIRPKELFQKYIDLGIEDIKTHFKDSKLVTQNCPACTKKGEFAFNKSGFFYEECPNCKTLFVNPRAEWKAFKNYYSDSKSSKFWANEFYKITEQNRRDNIWKPKAKLVSKKIKSFKDIKHVVDIGGGYGIFIEELKNLNKNLNTMIIEPSSQLAKKCEEKGHNVICDFFENIEPKDLPNKKTLYTSFELFEHLYNPKHFLEKLYNTMRKNDIFLFTTLNGMGIDIQILWENSKSVSPPHHLNFFNPKSIKLLLSTIGFKILEITTPGKLDIDILTNNKEQITDRFWKNFLEYSTKNEKKNMQKYISNNLLSSHMMIICQK